MNEEQTLTAQKNSRHHEILKQTLTAKNDKDSRGTLTLTTGKKAQQEVPTLTGRIKSRKRSSTLTRTAGGGTGELVDKADWEIGDIIDGRYDVREVLGRGGMGIVYKVTHREWRVELAVKMPLPHLVADKTSKARFIHEAQTWVNLGLHPNIVQCWYVRELGGVPRVFMDYVGGGSLKDWFVGGKVGPGNWEMILDLVIQACDGLSYAHERGITAHRDVKPANILIANDGDVFVTDFGIAKCGGLPGETADGASANPQHTVTMSGGNAGTPEYSAPEQWDRTGHVDGRADVYALGGVLFELCCGRRPFDDGSHSEPPHVLIGRHLSSPPPDPREFYPDIPQCLTAIMLRCLAKDPRQRPSSMATLREELTKAYTEVIRKRYRRAVPHAVELRADGMNNQAVSLMDLGNKSGAFATWQEALKLDPYHPESTYNRALLEWIEGRITDDDALKRLEDVRHIGRRANLYLGFIHLERAAAGEAARELAEALEDPVLAMSGETWQSLGDARMAREEFSEAEDAYQHAITLIPEDLGNLERQTLAQVQTREYDGQVIFPDAHCARIFEGRHTNDVTAVSITPDGRIIISAGRDSTLHVWDLATGEHLNTCDRYRTEMTAVAVTPDNRCILSGSDDGTLWLWDLSTAQYLRIFEKHNDSVEAVAVAPNGRFAISGSRDESLKMWDLATAQSLRSFTGHAAAVTAVAITPDSSVMVSGSRDATLRLWTLATGKCFRVIRGHAAGITALALTSNTRYVVSGSEDGTLWLWEVATAKCLRVLKGHHRKVTSVAVAPSGRFIVSGSADQTVRLWDFMTGRCLRTFRGHDGEVTSVTIAPDGDVVASGSTDATVRAWKLELDAQRYEATMRVCRQQSLEKIQSSTKRFRERLSWARTARETGKTDAAYKYLTQARAVSGYERAPEALALNAVIGKKIPRKGVLGGWLVSTFEGHAGKINAVAVTPDGHFAVSASADATLRLWDLETGRCSRIFEGHTEPVTAVAITPDGRFVVSGSADKTLRLWNLVTAKCLRIYAGHTHTVSAVAVSPYGRFLISGSLDRTLRMWNPATTECLHLFKGHGKAVMAVDMTPNRRFVLSGCVCRNILLWNRETAQYVLSFKGHTKAVTALEVAPGGQFALSASRDKTLRTWNIESGQCLTTFTGHTDGVSSVAITPDARFAVSGSLDKTLRVWNCRTGESVWSFEGHRLGVEAVALTPDARFVVSGSRDKTLNLWELDWEFDPHAIADSESALKNPKPKRGTHRITTLFNR